MSTPQAPPRRCRCTADVQDVDCILHGHTGPQPDYGMATLGASYLSLALWVVGTAVLVAGYESSVASVVLRVLGWSALAVALLVHAHGWSILARSQRDR